MLSDSLVRRLMKENGKSAYYLCSCFVWILNNLWNDKCHKNFYYEVRVGSGVCCSTALGRRIRQIWKKKVLGVILKNRNKKSTSTSVKSFVKWRSKIQSKTHNRKKTKYNFKYLLFVDSEWKKAFFLILNIFFVFVFAFHWWYFPVFPLSQTISWFL